MSRDATKIWICLMIGLIMGQLAVVGLGLLYIYLDVMTGRLWFWLGVNSTLTLVVLRMLIGDVRRLCADPRSPD